MRPRPLHRPFPAAFVLGLAILAIAAVGGVLPSAAAKEAGTSPAQPGDRITWTNELAKAFEKAVRLKKPVMICINSRRVDGGREEPAAKGLRERVYKDPRVVGKSRAFVCAFLTSEGSSDDYGELRLRFGIEGLIVSPQHIFAHPEHKPGAKPLGRLEYWPHGTDERGVKELLKLMDAALASYRAHEGKPTTPATPGEGAPEGPGAEPEEAPAGPDTDDARKKWIEKMIHLVKNAIEDTRRQSLDSLITNDQDGDCIDPVVGLMTELDGNDKKLDVLVDVVRALGRPGMEAAVEKIHDFLKEKDESLRANAAVSLEYIGSKTSVAPLLARVKREKVENIANHMYRALGRCGAGEAKVRTLLAKKSKGSKSENAAYGPIVGLAYFEKDAKAARAVEKMLAAMGTPGGGRRGGGRGTLKRALLAWTLSEIGDPKSTAFMREKMLKPLEHSNSWWTGAVTEYYAAVARKCDGDAEAADAIDRGITGTLSFAGGTGAFLEDPRKEREGTNFTPKGDWDVAGRGGRGGFPGGGRGGGR